MIGLYPTTNQCVYVVRASQVGHAMICKRLKGTTISWIRARVSFALLRGALLCLIGSRAKRRPTTSIRETDLEIEKGLAGLS